MGREHEGELVDVLAGWEGHPVTVRVLAGADELVAVFSGALGGRSDEKRPALFWPVEAGPAASGRAERPGVYAHPELLTDVRVRVGEFVVEYDQAGVTVNLRRLD
jgi:hypothetical protein